MTKMVIVFIFSEIHFYISHFKNNIYIYDCLIFFSENTGTYHMKND